MQEPWEIFWSTCVQAGIAGRGGETRGAGRMGVQAAAISRAAEATIKYLRNQRDWTWVNARILTGRLVDTATEWAMGGGRSANDLRLRLRETWREECAVAHREEEFRALTQALLDGSHAREVCVVRDDAAA